MLPIGLNLSNKNVLIVGAGKVALRKAKLFLSQNANLTIVSPQFLDEFLEIEATCIVDTYSKTYLDHMFLVYACTSDKDVNDTIVEDCNALNILCGSATRNRNVSFNSMAFEDTKVGVVALSTHQKMPYTKPILNELKETLQSKEIQLSHLALIREHLVETKQVSSELLDKLYHVSSEVLSFISKSIQLKEGYIFVYHQSDFKQRYVFDLEPSIVVSLKEFEMLQEVFSLNQSCKVIPLLLSDGFIYQKLKKMSTLKVMEPLICNEDDLKQMIQLLRQENKTNIWLMHPRSQMTLFNQMKASVPNGDIVQTFEDELKIEEPANTHVVVLLMSEGQHYHELIAQLPASVLVSKILPLEDSIKQMILQKRNGK